MQYKAVVFDLDGTLLDTLDDLAASMNAALGRFGLETHPADDYRYFVGDGLDNLVRRVAPAARDDGELAEKLLDAMRDEYSRRWADKTQPYAGVAKMLDGLTDRGLAITVLSNKPDDFTGLCVRRLLGDWRFEIVQGVSDDVPAKPDPAGAIMISERLGIAPGEFLYLGDTDTDMKTANAAGMYAVGATWGFRTPEELRDNGAKALIDHPTGLLELL